MPTGSNEFSSSLMVSLINACIELLCPQIFYHFFDREISSVKTEKQDKKTLFMKHLLINQKLLPSCEWKNEKERKQGCLCLGSKE